MPEGAQPFADLMLDSNLASVDRVEALTIEAAQSLGFDVDTQHDLGIAVRESMVNAVAHGNRYNARKKVHFRLETTGNRLSIEIEDEGVGFNPEAVPDPREGENVLRQSGRGLLMIRAYTDEFEIGPREPSGTRVRMVKYVNPGGAPGAS
ncbi:MAG: ATP-binding protein [Bryobacteraceae bacterium]